MVDDENPYAPPQTSVRIVGIKSGRREDLKSVAMAQKGIIVCILLYVAALAGQFFVPADYRPFVGVAVLVLGIVSMAFVVMLAMKVYSTVTGIIYGIGTIIPCIGLLILLSISTKATRILKENGYEVGLFGADLSKFDA
jgi:hypothetical protein